MHIQVLMKWINEGNRMPRAKDVAHQYYNLMMLCWSFDREARPSFADLEEVLTDWGANEKLRKKGQHLVGNNGKHVKCKLFEGLEHVKGIKL